jgi:hypothetical protein
MLQKRFVRDSLAVMKEKRSEVGDPEVSKSNDSY